MPYYIILDHSVITTPRAPNGWRASVVTAPGVYADGATEDEALTKLAALFAEPRRAPQDVEHAPAGWQV